MIDKDFLIAECEKFGVHLSEKQADVLDAFSKFVLEENKKYNLTAILDPEAFTEKHLIDSLTALPFIPKGAVLCDVGAGAGFPSFPIAAAREDVMVTALDSTSKKTGFIARAAEKSGLKNLSVLTKRAEECTHERESFDVVTARAVAPLPILTEISLPLLKIGGVFIAYKTKKEEPPSNRNLSLSGGRIKDVISYSLPSGDGRVLYIIEKVSNTSPDLPRPYGKIKKSPL